jgi:vitamin B12 transporter
MMGQKGGGRSTYGELAAGAMWRWRPLEVDGSVGVAAPLGNTAPPWPEAKLMATWTPNSVLQLRATGARKGRLPTLRELYDPLIGNPKLNPEQSWFGELALLVKPHPLFGAHVSGYYRYTDNLIRLDVETRTHEVNYDNVATYGLESGLDLAPSKPISAGATYIFEEALSPSIGLDAINNFARHKVDLWLAARLRNQAGALARFRYVADRVDSGVKLANYEVLDLSAWMRLSRQLRATLLVSNVTDNRYQVRAGVSDIGRIISLALEGTWE